MSTSTEFTARLNLPYINAGQAQKHVTLNESLRAFDVLVQTSVKSAQISVPPTFPVEGDTYLVAPSATGAWTDKDLQIANYQDDSWAFHNPQIGWRVYDVASASLLIFDGSVWNTFQAGAGSSDMATFFGINTTADTYNRLSVKTDAGFFSHDDVSGNGSGDVRIDFNKLSQSHTASLLFKTNWTAHAEIGLAGNNKLTAKVSPDGNTWFTAWEVDQNTGAVTFPNSSLAQINSPVPDFVDTSGATYFYYGFSDFDGAGNWLLRRRLRSDASTQDATTGAADFSAAWLNRTTLAYA